MQDTEQYHRFYNAEDPNRWGRSEMPEQLEATRQWLCEVAALDSQKIVLELGCGVGALSGLHINYIGLDFSLAALKKFIGDAKLINGDMQLLPLKNESVDFIFSWAALEHVPNPERVLEEVGRVLKVGGTVLLAPAWNVRPWAAKALPVRSYRELSWSDRVSKATIPLRNSIVWRSIFTMPARLYREASAYSESPLVFDYKKLSPNLQEYVYTDCDAFTSMDSHAAIMFFKSRNWNILSHRSFFSRILARHEPVVFQKVK
jgi:ubiquinone/menaquinone biosynthesis C-methylase UbiE